MPRLDQTGPQGMGPSTGGARGECGDGQASRGYFGRSRRKNACCGKRGRHGGGMEYCATDNPAFDMNREGFLKAEQAHLKNRLDFIQKELDNISTEAKKTDETES